MKLKAFFSLMGISIAPLIFSVGAGFRNSDLWFDYDCIKIPAINQSTSNSSPVSPLLSESRDRYSHSVCGNLLR